MKRPVFLTIWLILIGLGDLFSLYSYTLGAATITKALPNFPSWALILFAILVVVQLVGVALLWMWKKLGFYLYLGSAAIALVLNILTLGVAGGLTSILGAVVGTAILYLAMRPVWQNFA